MFVLVQDLREQEVGVGLRFLLALGGCWTVVGVREMVPVGLVVRDVGFGAPDDERSGPFDAADDAVHAAALAKLGLNCVFCYAICFWRLGGPVCVPYCW